MLDNQEDPVTRPEDSKHLKHSSRNWERYRIKLFGELPRCEVKARFANA